MNTKKLLGSQLLRFPALTHHPLTYQGDRKHRAACGGPGGAAADLPQPQPASVLQRPWPAPRQDSLWCSLLHIPGEAWECGVCVCLWMRWCKVYEWRNSRAWKVDEEENGKGKVLWHVVLVLVFLIVCVWVCIVEIENDNIHLYYVIQHVVMCLSFACPLEISHFQVQNKELVWWVNLL